MKTKAIQSFFSERFMEISQISVKLREQIDILFAMVATLKKVREKKGRLFICGVGGGAGNGTHAAGDFLKSCNIQAICLTDNVPSITAFTNDEGWAGVFIGTFKAYALGKKDAILIFSVGGGDEERNISANIVKAVDYAKSKGAKVLGIVGKKDGYTARHGDAVIVIPAVNPAFITAHTESFQCYISHLLTETLRQKSAKWESLGGEKNDAKK